VFCRTYSLRNGIGGNLKEERLHLASLHPICCHNFALDLCRLLALMITVIVLAALSETTVPTFVMFTQVRPTFYENDRIRIS
jgi:hypothetical protein